MIIAHNTPVNYIGKVARLAPSHLLFVDAIDAGLAPGSVILASPDDVKRTSSTSTHYQEFDELISFLASQAIMPFKTMILGIQIKDVSLTEKMTPEVEKSGLVVSQVLCSILSELKNVES